MGIKRFVLLAVFFMFIFCGTVCAQDQDEEIVLTTYYPAPYGDYDMLVLEPMNGPPVISAPNGAMYFDDGSHASRERGLHIYDSTDGGWVHAAERFGVPTGTIVMWSGTIANIPAGWAFCDGNNGTPNLRSRFIVGVGAAYAVGDTGGVNDFTLLIRHMPSHTHTGSTNNAGNHSHSYTYGTTTRTGSSNPQVRTTSGGNRSNTDSAGSHSHTITMNNTGRGEAHENRPPYYALCYIMKL